MHNRPLVSEIIVPPQTLTDEKMREIADFLISGKAPQQFKINLSQNMISDPALDMLMKALMHQHCPNTLAITMNHMYLGDEAMHEFAKVFEAGCYPTHLRLDFGSNFVGNDGLIDLAQSLSRKDNRPGVYFDFQSNPTLTDACLVVLADMIENNQIADGTGFNLDSNPTFNYPAARKLAAALEANTAITALVIETRDEELLLINNLVDDLPVVPSQGLYQYTLAYCSDRNQLLQKYRGDPDMLQFIHNLSKTANYAPPANAAIMQHVPSLRFFAAKAAGHTDLAAFIKRYPGCLENLCQMADSMTEVADKLDPERRSRSSCPWTCTIL